MDAHETAMQHLSLLTDVKHPPMTPRSAVELARMLCHIAGGDGRGTFKVVHQDHD